jgi:hypothetical protein
VELPLPPGVAVEVAVAVLELVSVAAGAGAGSTGAGSTGAGSTGAGSGWVGSTTSVGAGSWALTSIWGKLDSNRIERMTGNSVLLIDMVYR